MTSGAAAGSALPAPHPGEHANQQSLFRAGQWLHGMDPGGGDRAVQCAEKLESLLGDPAHHLATVVAAPFPSHQLLALELVEQPGDARGLLDHAVGDVQRRQSGLSGSPQNAQHVVLLQGDAVRFYQLGEAPLELVGRAIQGQDGFLGRRLKRLALPDLFTQRSRSSAGHVELDDGSTIFGCKFSAGSARSRLFVMDARLCRGRTFDRGHRESYDSLFRTRTDVPRHAPAPFSPRDGLPMKTGNALHNLLLTVPSSATATFLALFPIVNPFGGIPLFFSITSGFTPQDRYRAAMKTGAYVFAILVTFLFFGRLVLNFFGISLPVLQIAGGLIVANTAWGMVTGSNRITPAESDEAATKEDISLTPMAMPMLSGPGSIGVVMGLAAHVDNLTAYIGMVIGIAALALTVYLFLRLGGPLVAKLGPGAVGAINRSVGVLILASSVQPLRERVAEIRSQL